MSSPLFSFPPGLLGFLRQKVGGAAPDKFSDTLQPTMEIGELYGRAENITAANTATALGPLVLQTVPATERWWLIGLSVDVVTAGVSNPANPNLAIDTGAGTPIISVTRSVYPLYIPTIANQVLTLVADLPRPWVLEPGSRILAHFKIPTVFATNWGATGTARIYRLPI